MARRNRTKSFNDIMQQADRLMIAAGRRSDRGRRVLGISSRYGINATRYNPPIGEWRQTTQVPQRVYMGLNEG